MNSLPTRLKKEPLLDAIFECRLDVDMPLSNFLPGHFLNGFREKNKKATISNLPLSEMPQVIRQSNPDFQYAPLVQIEVDDFRIFVSDGSFSISCSQPPYPGWSKFKEFICEVFSLLILSNLKSDIDRYSIKYIDFLEYSGFENRIDATTMYLKINDREIKNELFQLTVEIESDCKQFVNSIQLVSSANIEGGKYTKQTNGIIFEIDTICLLPKEKNLRVFYDELNNALDNIHDENKKIFFTSISQNALDILEPEYGN